MILVEMRDDLKDDFEEAMEILRQAPGVSDYLDSREVRIGRAVTARRVERGNNPEELAAHARVTLAEVSAMELGLTHETMKAAVSPEAVQRIFQALDMAGFPPSGEEAAAKA